MEEPGCNLESTFLFTTLVSNLIACLLNPLHLSLLGPHSHIYIFLSPHKLLLKLKLDKLEQNISTKHLLRIAVISYLKI